MKQLLLCWLFVIFLQVRAASGNLHLSLTSTQASYKEAEAVMIRLDVSGKRKILAQNLPTKNGELNSNLFQVLIEGKPVNYLGRLSKSLPSIVDLADGSLSFNIDLSKTYDFSITGIYQIKFVVENFESNMVEMFVYGRNFPIPLTPSVLNLCTSSDQIDIATAKAATLVYVNEAIAYLNGVIGVRYTTWFGILDSTRLAYHKTSYANQKTLLEKAGGVDFDCSFTDCNSGTFAFVYTNDVNHVVHLCTSFWNAANTGTDSRAGTLVHELSHFLDIASTQDYVYGQTGAKALAISNPAQGSHNADSHEYFAENTPNLEPGAVTFTPTKSPSKSPTTSKPTKNPVSSLPTKSPTKSPTTSKPTRSPTKSPTSSKPTKNPVSSLPTKSPTKSPTLRSPTKSPTSSKPSNSPISSLPTKSPSKSPSKSPVSAVTAAPLTKSPTKFPSIDFNPACRPQQGTSKKECNKLIKKCDNLGFPMKWNGQSCPNIVVGGRPLTSGCQCSNYCGYSCQAACKSDSACYWNLGACFNKKTGERGTAVSFCASADT